MAREYRASLRQQAQFVGSFVLAWSRKLDGLLAKENRASENDLEEWDRRTLHWECAEWHHWIKKHEQLLHQQAADGRVERRFLSSSRRAMVGESPRSALGLAVCGLASVFESDDESTHFWILPDGVETIAPTAFDRALRENQNTHCLVGHDDNFPLGSVGRGNLALKKTPRGLHYSCELQVDSDLTRRVVAAIWDKALSGSSFAFSLPEDGSGEEFALLPNGIVHRRIVSIKTLHDVGPCERGAYAGATAYVSRVNELAYVA